MKILNIMSRWLNYVCMQCLRPQLLWTELSFLNQTLSVYVMCLGIIAIAHIMKLKCPNIWPFCHGVGKYIKSFFHIYVILAYFQCPTLGQYCHCSDSTQNSYLQILHEWIWMVPGNANAPQHCPLWSLNKTFCQSGNCNAIYSYISLPCTAMMHAKFLGIRLGEGGFLYSV